MKKIAIIGAGIAGLACARVLSAQGHQLTIFDKGRGPGGRMSTRRVMTSFGEISFDHGAQYFTARDHDFVGEVQRLKGLGAVSEWTGELVTLHSDGSNSPLARETLYVGTPAMNSVIRVLANGFTIAWSTRVETIDQEGKAWRLGSETGTELGIFDAVVCAVPAEQVAPLLEPIAPNFAAKGKAVASLPCWAGLFAFDTPITVPFDGMRLEGHAIIDFIAVNHSKPGRTYTPSYVVHANPDWSRAHLEESAETVAELLLAALLTFSDNAPNTVHASAHRWRYARIDTRHGPGFLWDGSRAIGVCGDWLSGPRVESAWLSGHQLGLEILEQTSGSRSCIGKAGD